MTKWTHGRYLVLVNSIFKPVEKIEGKVGMVWFDYQARTGIVSLIGEDLGSVVVTYKKFCRPTVLSGNLAILGEPPFTDNGHRIPGNTRVFLFTDGRWCLMDRVDFVRQRLNLSV